MLIDEVPSTEQRGEDCEAAHPSPLAKRRLHSSRSRFRKIGGVWRASRLPCLRLDATDEQWLKSQWSLVVCMMVCSSSKESQAMYHGFLGERRYGREYRAGSEARMVIIM